jgi:leader peptidase (prepilin peptidase) / N-methyltransferase
MTDTEQLHNAAAKVVIPLALLAWMWLWMTHPGWIDLIFGAFLLACVADVVIYDWTIMIVPDRSVVGIFASGWLYTAAANALAGGGWSGAAMLGERPVEHLMQSVVLGGSAWLLALIYRLARRREGLGLGDIKLIGAAGAWLTIEAALDAITLAALAALAVVIVLALIRGVKTGLSLAIPFAVFLAPAFWTVWALSR